MSPQNHLPPLTTFNDGGYEINDYRRQNHSTEFDVTASLRRGESQIADIG